MGRRKREREREEEKWTHHHRPLARETEISHVGPSVYA